MRVRLAYALTAVLALAGAASADPPSPAIVVQAKPVSRLLVEYKEVLRQVGGTAQGDAMVKEFEKELKGGLGELGFEGLDINRPIAAYSVLKDKGEDCGFVLVVPVTGEKEFVAFLGRMELKAEAVKDKKGLYTLRFPDDELFPKGSHVRFTDGGWAYVTLNDGDPTDAKDLVAVGTLFENADNSLFSVKVFPGRVPAKLVAGLLDDLDQTAGQLKALFGVGDPAQAEAKMYGAILEQGPKLLRRYAETGLKEAAEAGAKFSFDPMTGDTVTELTLVPKPGTPLAAEIAATRATTNRFAGLVTKDAAASGLVKAPLFAKELREITAAVLESGTAGLKQGDLPQTFAPVVEEIAKGLVRSVKKGEVDAGFALLGPDKDGTFTLVGGVSFDDPAGLEKALREAAKPADLAKHFEFDAAKVGGVSVHKVPLTRLFKEDALAGVEKVFGAKPPAYVAFAKDAAFVGFGPAALDAVKAALESKAGPAPAVDVNVNLNRLQKLVATTDPKGGVEFAKFMGTADKSVNALRVTVDGGAKLTATVTVNVRLVPRLFLVGENSTTTFEKVGEKIK